MKNSESPVKEPRWKMDADKKLYAKGPFKLRVGSRVFNFRFAENYSEARALLSRGRFKDIGQMVDAVKLIPNGY